MPATKNPDLVARKLLRELGVKKGAIQLDLVTKKLGIQVVRERFEEDLSGVLIRRGTSVVIGVNSRHHENRQRFSIAHEIGHFVLGHPGEMIVDKTLRQKAVVVRRDGRSSEGTDKQEVEANRFAAELLMPADTVEEEVRKCLARKKISSLEMLIRELASLFQVSTQAMEIRLVNLGFLIPQGTD